MNISRNITASALKPFVWPRKCPVSSVQYLSEKKTPKTSRFFPTIIHENQKLANLIIGLKVRKGLPLTMPQHVIGQRFNYRIFV
jgi:hypothetical protein